MKRSTYTTVVNAADCLGGAGVAQNGGQDASQAEKSPSVAAKLLLSISAL